MGKLAVFVFAVLAVQAAFGGVTKGYGYGQEEVKDLVHQVTKVADEVIETLKTTPLRRGFSWENREFDQEIEEIINYLEQLTIRGDAKVSNVIASAIHELREMHTYFQQLSTSTDVTFMRKMEMSMAANIKKIVSQMKSWVKYFGEESYNGSVHTEIKTILQRFVVALRKLDEHINAFEVRDSDRTGLYSSKGSMYGDRLANEWSGDYLNNEYSRDSLSSEFPRGYLKNERSGDFMNKKWEREFSGDNWTPSEYLRSGKDALTIVKELEITLERINFDNVLMKRALVHLVREYVANLQQFSVPELHHLYELFLNTNIPTPSVHEVKGQLFAFIKTFIGSIERMPETAHVAFLKATRIFQGRLDTMLEVNTPVRRLVFRMRALSDFLSTGYEIVPSQSANAKHIIEENARHFVQQLARIAAKIVVPEGDKEFVANWQKIVARLENTSTEQSLALAIQEATTEVHKWLMARPTSGNAAFEVATEYVEILKAQWKLFNEMSKQTRDIYVWGMHLMAMTNKMSMYLHQDVNADDLNIIMEATRGIFAILETESHPEYKEVYYALKKIVHEYETEPYKINTFLQNYAFQLSRLAWTIYERTETFPTNVMEILNVFLFAIEDIQLNHRIIRGLVLVNTPVETVMQIESVADRLTKMLHVIVPGFKHNKLFYRAHRFHQMLEVAIYKLRQISSGPQKTEGAVKKAYKNLLDIQSSIEDDLKQHDMYFKVKLGVYIKDAVMELKSLAFELKYQQNGEFVKLYGNFLNGMRHLLNQVQYDFQVVSDEYSVKTLQMQITSVAHRVSTLLQRVQLKPELKRLILAQIDIIALEVRSLRKFVEKMPAAHELSAKYAQMHEQFVRVAQMGRSKTVEELAEFLDIHIREIVGDLERLSYLALETPQFYDIFRCNLVTLSHVMVRLDNVHYYEYYQSIINTEDFVGLIRKVSSAVSGKLQNTFADSTTARNDLAIQLLKYATRLDKVAVRFQVEAKVPLRGLYEIVATLVQQVRPDTITINELKAKLTHTLLNVATEIQSILAQESHVGTENAMIKYMVTVEKLYIHIHHILVRSHKKTPVHQLISHVNTHVHYLTKAIEHINPENKVAFAILSAEYRRLVQFVATIPKRLSEFGDNHEKFQRIFNKLTAFEFVETENHEDVDELKIKIAVYVQHVTYVLRELTWLVPEVYQYQQGSFTSTGLTSGSSDVTMAIETLWREFLVTVQRMRIDIGTNVLIQQRFHDLNKWGLVKANFAKLLRGENDYSNKYSSDYYGTFAKYFNKWGKNNQATFDKDYDYSRRFGNTFQDEYKSFNKRFGGEYEPKHGFLSKQYQGRFGRDYEFEGQFQDNFAQQGKYSSDEYLGYTMGHESFPESYRFGGYSSRQVYGKPEYFGKFSYGSRYETPKTYKHGDFKSMRQYETPEYFGKYSSGNDFESSDILALVRQIKNVAGDVSEDLQRVSTSTTSKSELVLYVRQLVQILDNIVDRLEGEKTYKSDIKYIVKSFMAIKAELKQVLTSGLFSQVGQVKYQLSNAIEQIATEIEKLTHLANISEVHILKDVFVPFFSYIRNVKYQIQNNVFGGDFEGYKTETNYNVKPWFYSNRGLNVPTASEWRRF